MFTVKLAYSGHSLSLDKKGLKESWPLYTQLILFRVRELISGYKNSLTTLATWVHILQFCQSLEIVIYLFRNNGRVFW